MTGLTSKKPCRINPFIGALIRSNSPRKKIKILDLTFAMPGLPDGFRAGRSTSANKYLNLLKKICCRLTFVGPVEASVRAFLSGSAGKGFQGQINRRSSTPQVIARQTKPGLWPGSKVTGKPVEKVRPEGP